MSSKEVAWLLATVATMIALVRLVPREPPRTFRNGLFIFLADGDGGRGRRGYAIAAYLLAMVLGIWSLRIAHLVFFGD